MLCICAASDSISIRWLASSHVFAFASALHYSCTYWFVKQPIKLDMEVGIRLMKHSSVLSLVPLFFFYIPWHQRGDAQWFLKKEPVDTCVTSEMRVMFFLFYVLVFRLVCRESWVKSCGTNPLNDSCLRWRSCGKMRLLWPWTDGDKGHGFVSTPRCICLGTLVLRQMDGQTASCVPDV